MEQIASFDISLAHQIHFYRVSKKKTEERICYNEKIYMDRGWCRTKGVEDWRWGICSTSCAYVGIEVADQNLAVKIPFILIKTQRTKLLIFYMS